MLVWLEGSAVGGKRTSEPGLPEKKKSQRRVEMAHLHLKVASKGSPTGKTGELGLFGFGGTSVSILCF